MGKRWGCCLPFRLEATGSKKELGLGWPCSYGRDALSSNGVEGTCCTGVAPIDTAGIPRAEYMWTSTRRRKASRPNGEK